MLTLPFLGRLIDKRPLVWTPILIAASYLCEAGLHYIIPDINAQTPLKSLFVFATCLPTILLGYFFARKTLFQKITLPAHWATAVAALLAICLIFPLRAKFGGLLGFSFDFFYAPATILCILAIFNICQLKYTRMVLTALGDQSVYMWFFHALFFVPPVRTIFQPLIRISDNIFVVTLWSIALTFCISWALHKIVDSVIAFGRG